MKNPLVFGLIAGFVTGIIVGIIIRSVGPIDNLIPDNLNSFITGGVAGAVAVLVYGKRKNKSSPPQ